MHNYACNGHAEKREYLEPATLGYFQCSCCAVEMRMRVWKLHADESGELCRLSIQMNQRRRNPIIDVHTFASWQFGVCIDGGKMENSVSHADIKGLMHGCDKFFFLNVPTVFGRHVSCQIN